METKTKIQDRIKVPPQDIDAEQAVLGGLMIDNNAIIKVADLLSPHDFYNPHHVTIYSAILELFEKHHPTDILNLSSRLKEKEKLQEIGGKSYLADLINKIPSSFHVASYAERVKEKKVMRDLIEASVVINETAYNFNGDTEELLDHVEQKIFNIAKHADRAKFVSIKEELEEAFERIEKLQGGSKELRGVPTGFDELDGYLSGLQRSDLVVLGARPSFGKTALALDIARQACKKTGKAVGIFSLEMSRDQITDRLLSAESQLPLWRLRTQRITDETEFQMLHAAMDNLSKLPIFIDDTASPTILHLRTNARRLQLENDLCLLVVDYLQLIQPRINRDNVVQQITEVSRGLKAMAKELNIPILALSQLSRAVDQREVRIPRLSDLRESGSIEQDSDVVLFLYRKDREKKERLEAPTAEEENLTEVIIAKHRNGPLGTVKLKFDPERVSFRTIDKFH
ncbi:MAG: replicative DNA helicase [Candidatus Harrisonbacteria bacterium RIFCSPLOWO2_01_FULL_40_28]|uniref:Replicative DNA helicase n=2 Tax=Candidatus Harrisoniibacteriota TaxID=1817905 RepID=A0A1G1ZXR9_9BACT|nr:MAG: replicative DNA helicase [Candidatus Harrisonbacteria bacterium RIFCSPLOWO2_01_FULL_40_28]OGY69384.1 MAG: replicative DNA helicase [Candidatus Harrisonbacteria bacterium RIFOXYD1_FULL_40_9]